MINSDAIYTPTAGEILQVIGDSAGRTTNWLLLVKDCAWVPGGEYRLGITGQITAAKLNPTTDMLRANQKASIDRLLKHLKHHCPALGEAARLETIFARCDYKEGPTS